MQILTHGVAGNGPPLLLLNGGLMTYAAWEPLAVPLARSCHVIRCDFRGQLLSPGVPPSTLSGHVSDLVELMDTLGVKNTHVAGASFGALVGLTMAAEVPARVRSIVAITATERMTPDMAESGAELCEACRIAAEGGDPGRVFDLVNDATWSEAYRQSQAAVLAARRQGMALLPRSWYASLLQLMAPLDGLDLRPLLLRIACPTLVIGGDADVTFPVEHSRALAASIPHARLVVMPGGSHGLSIERAAEVADLVASFVRDVEAQRAPA